MLSPPAVLRLLGLAVVFRTATPSAASVQMGVADMCRPGHRTTPQAALLPYFFSARFPAEGL